MFIDEKIKYFIEHEKNEWYECRKLLEKIKEEIKEYKELCKYLNTYENDLIHQELKKDFNKVLDNIESLANTFEFKEAIEISMLNTILIHYGYLSLECKYSCKFPLEDILYFLDDKTLYIALKIFTGVGCCRHVASFTKQVLDRFNIKNSMVIVDVNNLGYNINKIRLFLNNFHKSKSTHVNHAITYISDNGYNYFLDLTTDQTIIFKALNQFSISVDGEDLFYPLNSYDYSLYNNEFIDFRKVPELRKIEVDYLINKANDNIDICDANKDLLMQFYLQNRDNYRKIIENYNKVYEKEKSLRLIKCDKQK